MRNKIILAAFAVGLLGFAGPAAATVIDFETHNTRNNFNALGISDTYLGYEWAYGTTPGTINRTNTSKGWAFASTSAHGTNPGPGNIQGNSYAWNWSGPQSLWIDFGGATDVTSALLATFAPGYGSNATTLQLFGYAADMTLLSTSAIVNLTDTLTQSIFNFAGITLLEIRANADGQWFTLDNLVIGENAGGGGGGSTGVPEPASLGLFGMGLLGLARLRRRRKAI